MADPVTAGLSLAAGVGSGIFSALGVGASSKAQASQYQYQAGLAAQNAQIAKQNEAYALMQGEQAAAQSGMATASRLGQIKTGEAASGFNVNTGSNARVQASQKMIGDMEQTAIRSTSAKRAYDYDIGALQATEQSSAYSAAASNVKSAAPLAEAASILGSASSVASKWGGFSQSGALNGISNAFFTPGDTSF